MWVGGVRGEKPLNSTEVKGPKNARRRVEKGVQGEVNIGKLEHRGF